MRKSLRHHEKGTARGYSKSHMNIGGNYLSERLAKENMTHLQMENKKVPALSSCCKPSAYHVLVSHHCWCWSRAEKRQLMYTVTPSLDGKERKGGAGYSKIRDRNEELGGEGE